MSRANYNSLWGILRVRAAGERELDPFVSDVLNYHAALEIEVDELLIRLLPRGERLTGGQARLSFRHKVAILDAAWIGKPESGELLIKALIRFNDLRDMVAHTDKGARKVFADLAEKCAALNPDQPNDPSPYDLAISICSFMGDGPSVMEALKVADAIEEAFKELKVRMPSKFVAKD